ncbi:THO complex subunit 4A [Rhypophila sp. PSN 637]
MDNSLDRSLDEILADRKQSGRPSRGLRGNGNNGGGRRRERENYPRDGVRKRPISTAGQSFRDRDDAPRNLDSEWVHDKYEDSDSRRGPRRDYRSGSPSGSDTRGSKIRVDNIHYELTREDMEDLFSRIGPLVKLDMKYDRAGRSEGTAFVTYESHRDAAQAIREYDGANAAGQPIRLTLMPTGPSRRNPLETAVKPGRPLAERITLPPGGGRSRSLSPNRQQSDEEAARRGTDRYRPGGGGAKGSRSRSPLPNRGRREGGRRPGARREGGGGGRRGGGGGGGERAERSGRDGRPKKTQEELDAEMADYFNAGGPSQQGGDSSAAGFGANNGTNAPVEDDVDMIE